MMEWVETYMSLRLCNSILPYDSHQGSKQAKNLKAPKIEGLQYIFYTSGIEMCQHFQGPFGLLVLTFCFTLPNK